MCMTQTMACRRMDGVSEAWGLLFQELEKELVEYFQFGPPVISGLSITPLTEEAEKYLAIINRSAEPELAIARHLNGCSKLQRPMRATNDFNIVSRNRPKAPSSDGTFEFKMFFSTACQP